MDVIYRPGATPPGELSACERRSKGVTLGRRDWLALLVWLPLALLLYVNVKCAAVQGRSMEPAFHSGRRVLVWKTVPAGGYHPGDVVVFRGDDGVEMIKRIALIHRGPIEGLRGLYWTRDGARRGLPLALLFTPYLCARDLGTCPPPEPDQTIYVVGDNFANSYDSRDYGPISPRQILGKVLF